MKSNLSDSQVSSVVDRNGATKVLTLGDFDDDEWGPPPDLCEQGPRWSELTAFEKLKRVVLGIAKCIGLLLLLWVFVCSLDLLSSSFRLVGGKEAGRIFQEGGALRNPVVGLMVGVLATVLVQSSSTSTSVVVALVGSGVLRVREAIPVVMGANIGTSVTNTVVSLGQVGDRREFRRAFAAATIHDMFNWLAVIVLLPLEVATGYLEFVTGAIMESGDWQHREGAKAQPSFLQKITKPVTSLLVQLDKKVIEKMATGQLNDTGDVSLLKSCSNNGTRKPCGYLLESIPWSDSALGVCLLVVSLVMLCSCLILLVKLLHSALGGPIATLLRRVINADPPPPFHLLVGWVAMLIGAGLTILVQSSSVFTSALTPLAGVGVVSLERIYPLTLGSNLGTTTTGLLAALAAPPTSIRSSLQIALCHLFFNLSGILLYYPIPATRFPIPLAKALGRVTAEYRWFSVLYLIVMFLALPLAVFGLSMAGPIVFASVGGPLLVILIVVVLINLVQRKRPSLLPMRMRDWSYLPEWMRSLDPMDRLVTRFCGCCLKEATNRRDGPAMIGGLVPNQSQVNILQNCSASSSVLTLNSVASGTEYHTMSGFENCAFGQPATPMKKPPPPGNNNNTLKPEWDFDGSTTAL